MRYYVLLIVFLIYFGLCRGGSGQKSGQTQCETERDSLVLVLHEQRMLIILTEKQVKRYAKIVSKNPSQSKYIVGWINRAFEGVVDTVHH